MPGNESILRYDRETYIADCKALIGSRQHFRMCGPRKVGKTTILEKLEGTVEQPYKYINCQLTDDKPWLIINRLARRVNWVPDANEHNWTEVGNQLLDHIESRYPDCVFIIDEFSTSIANMGEGDQEKFLNWFGMVLGADRRIVFGISGSISIDSVLRKYRYSARFEENITLVRIHPFEEDIARDFIRDLLLDMGVSVEEAALERFQDSCIECLGAKSLFPLFVRGFVECCIEDGLSEQRATDIPQFVEERYMKSIKSVVDAMKRLQAPPPYFREWGGYISFIQDDLKKTVGMSDGVAQDVSRLFMLETPTYDAIMAMDIPWVMDLINAMEDNYIVNKEDDGQRYDFYIKFLRDVWLQLYPVEVGDDDWEQTDVMP